METCYRHPDRETGVSCSNCGRPICPDCMTPTPVGMRCPECSRDRTPVKTLRSLQVDPTVTYVLLALNVLAFVGATASGGSFGQIGGTAAREGALFGPSVADGEWWRIVTGGFLHSGMLHILFNMYLLYVLGQMLEPALGHVRFAVIYVVSLVCGSLGALLLSPDAVTVGASGAVFGLMGAGVVALRARGIDPMASGLGPTILLNLGITFLIPGISIGGHLGGLLGGAVVGWLLTVPGERRGGRTPALAGAIALGVVAFGACIAAANALAGSPFS